MLTNLTTDGAGAFSATGVATPYDVVVFPSPTNPSAPPIAYFSLTTPHPRLGALPDIALPAAVPLYLNFYVPMTIPAACGLCSSTCISCSASWGIAPPGATITSLNAGSKTSITGPSYSPGDGGLGRMSFSYAFGGPSSTALTLDAVVVSRSELNANDAGYYFGEEAIALPPDAGSPDAASGAFTLDDASR